MANLYIRHIIEPQCLCQGDKRVNYAPLKLAGSRKFRFTLHEQAARRRLDRILQPFEKNLLRKPGWNRRQHLGTDRSGPESQGAARPIETGIERYRQTGHAEFGVELDDAV